MSVFGKKNHPDSNVTSVSRVPGSGDYKSVQVRISGSLDKCGGSEG